MRAAHKHTSLTLSLLLSLAGACVEDAPIDNDKPTDTTDSVSSADDGNAASGMGSGNGSQPGTGAGGDDSEGSGSDGIVGGGAGSDDGGSGPVDSVVAGTAIDARCAGNSKPQGAMCGGYYCGTTKDAIRAETRPQAVCSGEAQLGLLCSATLSTVVSRCARTAGQMVLASDEEKATYTRTCAKDDPALAQVTDPCLECFVESAKCARENCLVECLPGDSASCDKCRIDNGCTPSVFPCAGIPSPL
jgi:hypothetical protein